MKQAGVTLLELMVVLGISAILLVIGIPSFSGLIKSNRLVNATNELVTALHLARSEAIKRNSRVVLCASLTGASCVGSGDWRQGWLIFHDLNNNAQADDGERVIETRPAFGSGLNLKGNSPISKYISYTPTGATKFISGAFQAGTMTVCNESTTRGAARQVVISSTGRPRTVKLELPSCP